MRPLDDRSPAQKAVDKTFAKGSSKAPTFVRGQTPHWAYPCGCEASALEIRHCAVHKAGPVLLGALERLVMIRDMPARFTETGRIKAYSEARAAIKQAGGA